MSGTFANAADKMCPCDYHLLKSPCFLASVIHLSPQKDLCFSGLAKSLQKDGSLVTATGPVMVLMPVSTGVDLQQSLSFPNSAFRFHTFFGLSERDLANTMACSGIRRGPAADRKGGQGEQAPDTRG